MSISTQRNGETTTSPVDPVDPVVQHGFGISRLFEAQIWYLRCQRYQNVQHVIFEILYVSSWALFFFLVNASQFAFLLGFMAEFNLRSRHTLLHIQAHQTQKNLGENGVFFKHGYLYFFFVKLGERELVFSRLRLLEEEPFFCSFVSLIICIFIYSHEIWNVDAKTEGCHIHSMKNHGAIRSINLHVIASWTYDRSFCNRLQSLATQNTCLYPQKKIDTMTIII